MRTTALRRWTSWRIFVERYHTKPNPFFLLLVLCEGDRRPTGHFLLSTCPFSFWPLCKQLYEGRNTNSERIKKMFSWVVDKSVWKRNSSVRKSSNIHRDKALRGFGLNETGYSARLPKWGIFALLDSVSSKKFMLYFCISKRTHRYGFLKEKKIYQNGLGEIRFWSDSSPDALRVLQSWFHLSAHVFILHYQPMHCRLRLEQVPLPPSYVLCQFSLHNFYLCCDTTGFPLQFSPNPLYPPRVYLKSALFRKSSQTSPPDFRNGFGFLSTIWICYLSCRWENEVKCLWSDFIFPSRGNNFD